VWHSVFCNKFFVSRPPTPFTKNSFILVFYCFLFSFFRFFFLFFLSFCSCFCCALTPRKCSKIVPTFQINIILWYSARALWFFLLFSSLYLYYQFVKKFYLCINVFLRQQVYRIIPFLRVWVWCESLFCLLSIICVSIYLANSIISIFVLSNLARNKII
jgi:hypothetical protein